MTQQASIDSDLQALAREAAILLHVPFATITLHTLPGKTLFVDGSWAALHSNIDVSVLDNASAVEQNIPFFACVPIRSDNGATVGTLCCGSGEKRDLSESELNQLKSVATLIAARIANAEYVPAFIAH